jgi:phenylacetate-CoA ligase
VFGIHCTGHSKKQQGSFFLFNDWHHIEVVDENDNLVPEGTQGSLLVTPLYKTLQPLDRYRLSDTMAIKTTDQPFITLNRISGRTEERLTYPDQQGAKYTIHPFDMLAFYVPGLRQFQFEQTSPNTLLLRVSVLDGYSDTKQIAEEKLNEILVKTKTKKFVSGKVEIVNSIGLNPKTGKFKIIIPYS